jgi:hypothetical protein
VRPGAGEGFAVSLWLLLSRAWGYCSKYGKFVNGFCKRVKKWRALGAAKPPLRLFGYVIMGMVFEFVFNMKIMKSGPGFRPVRPLFRDHDAGFYSLC